MNQVMRSSSTTPKETVEELRQAIKAYELTGNGKMRHVEMMRNAADLIEKQETTLEMFAEAATLGALICDQDEIRESAGWDAFCALADGALGRHHGAMAEHEGEKA